MFPSHYLKGVPPYPVAFIVSVEKSAFSSSFHRSEPLGRLSLIFYAAPIFFMSTWCGL